MTARLQPTLGTLGVLALVALAMSVAGGRLGSPTTGIDDANIFFVYARSFSAGEGFVFNPGGERIEGFTSLLWVLICSGAMSIAQYPERLLLVLNVVLVWVTILFSLRSTVLRRAEETSGPSLIWASTFIFLLLLDFRYVVWNTITLMETALWGAVLTITAVLTLDDRARGFRHNVTFAALISLMLITRPEALVWGPAFLVLAYLKHGSTQLPRQARWSVTSTVLAFAVTAAALTLFRMSYFGMPLPNTYYAKVSPSLTFRLAEGGTYLWGYLSSGPVPFACGAAVALSIVHVLSTGLRDRHTLVLAVLGLVALMVPVLSGGDHFDGFRFYQSVSPMLLLALLNWLRFVVPGYFPAASPGALAQTVKLTSTATALAVVTTVGIADWVQYNVSWLRNEFDIAAIGRQRGSDVAAIFDGIRPMPDVATIAVGGFKYAYPGEVVDLMGLNNRAVALNGGNRVGLRSHAAFETHTLYELNPTVVAPLVQYSTDLQSAEQRRVFVDMVLKGVLQEKRFQAMYRLAEVRRSTPSGSIAFAAWYDNEFLRELERAPPSLSLEVVFLHVVAERPEAHAQHLGRSHLHAGRARQRLSDVLALQPFDVFF
jgi:hypothetical protein